ncbi:MAG TPA: CBS domain-containing protein [Gemmataceae bacterium]|nr:CBS domain-containing protein [Gemmataceae bacterium]
MKVSEVMTPSVQCIHTEATAQEAAERMKALDLGSLPVCDNDRLVGMLTDRDLVIRAMAHGDDPKSTTVRDNMTPDTIFCFEDQNVEDAARLMRDKQIRRLLVLNRNKRLVGILSLGDLAMETQDEHLAAETLERISEPAMQAW